MKLLLSTRTSRVGQSKVNENGFFFCIFDDEQEKNTTNCFLVQFIINCLYSTEESRFIFHLNGQSSQKIHRIKKSRIKYSCYAILNTLSASFVPLWHFKRLQPGFMAFLSEQNFFSFFFLVECNSPSNNSRIINESAIYAWLQLSLHYDSHHRNHL